MINVGFNFQKNFFSRLGSRLIQFKAHKNSIKSQSNPINNPTVTESSTNNFNFRFKSLFSSISSLFFSPFQEK
ncbi:hypothetical protein L1987_05869 [Smallanthus sonchifolius]|uniref:Uncharacterized protein n=1 Tax=Smallanthus sonchifolius TaxID=185202 RepID=A0ACB9JWR1_9ASTR|nr:hypothetical protein L1987_05869 [Smallanthus sonchifolius]